MLKIYFVVGMLLNLVYLQTQKIVIKSNHNQIKVIDGRKNKEEKTLSMKIRLVKRIGRLVRRISVKAKSGTIPYKGHKVSILK